MPQPRQQSMDFSGRQLVLGASSQIGLFILAGLERQYKSIWAVSRKPAPAWSKHLSATRWVTPDRVQEAIGSAGISIVSAGPLALLCELAESLPEIRHICAFSSASLWFKQYSPVSQERGQIEALRSAEQRLFEICGQRHIPLTVFRPTIIYGCGLDRSLSRLAHWVDRWGFLPVAVSAGGQRQPVHAEDLASLALLAQRGLTDYSKPLAVGGGSALSYRDMLKAVFKAKNKPARLLPIPVPLYAAIARLPLTRELNPAMVMRQGQDLTVDNHLIAKEFRFRPRLFELTEEAVSQPTAEQVKYWRDHPYRSKLQESG